MTVENAAETHLCDLAAGEALARYVRLSVRCILSTVLVRARARAYARTIRPIKAQFHFSKCPRGLGKYYNRDLILGRLQDKDLRQIPVSHQRNTATKIGGKASKLDRRDVACGGFCVV